MRRFSLAVSACLLLVTMTATATDIIMVDETSPPLDSSGYIAFLEGIYGTGSVNLVTDNRYFDDTFAANRAELDNADLIIVLRSLADAFYSAANWNSIPTPIMLHYENFAAEANWGWMSGGNGTRSEVYFELSAIADASDPVFNGPAGTVDVSTSFVPFFQTDHETRGMGSGRDLGTGVEVAQSGNGKAVTIIARWDTTDTYFSGEAPIARRMLLCNQGLDFFEPENSLESVFDPTVGLTSEGQIVYSNALQWLATPTDTDVNDWSLY